MPVKILKRTTSPKYLQPYLLKMEFVAKITDVQFTWIVDRCINWGFHYDMELSIIVEGDEDKIEMFDKMIEETKHKNIK